MHSPDHIYPTLSYTLFEDMARKFCALMHNGTKAAHSIEKEDFMKTLKTYMHIGIFFVITAGSLAHFFYDWSGHASIVGYFTPVNESIWEHMKLLFFPMLLYAFVLTVRLRHHAPSIPSALCTGILLGTFLIPLFFLQLYAGTWKSFFGVGY